MSFIWPAMIWSLALIPGLTLLYARMQLRRRKLITSYGGSWPSQVRRRRAVSWRRHIPPGIFLSGIALLLLALARPQMALSLPRMEGTVVLAFDVSGSMGADDLQPTRLEAAKAAALEFVEQQPASVRIGVVAFSDNGFIVQTPTSDQEAILTTVHRLNPQRGTSVANGIFAALETIASLDAMPQTSLYSNLTPVPTPEPTPMTSGEFTSAAIVLLTDGENNESPDPLAAAQAAADRGVRIYTVGIGSAAGTALHVNGFIVHTRLNEAILQQIAEDTGGTYYNAESEQDLREIYQNLDPELVMRSEEMEVTSIFAGASILVLLIGGAVSLLWFGRLP